MTDIFLLRSLGIMVVAAAAFMLVTRFARVPSIVAYLLAGLAIGPATGLLEPTEATELIAETGIVLLLFLVGLELSLDKIRDVGKVAVVAGLGQVAFTALGGFALSLLLGFSAIESIFIGTALTFSSTVVVVKVLTEKQELDSLYGRIAVGIFLVQDLVVIVILTFLAGLGGSAGMDLESTTIGLLAAFGGMGFLLLVAMLAARFVLPRLFGWISSSLEALFIWSLCWCFLLVVAAESMHLSIEIGAFLAGVSLAQLPYNQELRRRVHPLMNFFIAIFFTSLGLQMELGAAAEQWIPATVLSLFVLIGNPFIFMWIIAKLGYGDRTSFMTSVTVAQISEFSFIFVAMGMTMGLIDQTILSIVALVGLVTIAVSSYMILYNHRLYELFEGTPLLRMFGARREPVEPVGAPPLRGHVIVVGMNALGVRIVEELIARGERVLAIDTDPRKLERLRTATVLGSVDHPSVLEAANLEESKLVVSALQIEDTNNLLAYRCGEAGVPCSIHAFDRSVIEELRTVGATHLMIPKYNGIRRIIGELRKRGVVGT